MQLQHPLRVFGVRLFRRPAALDDDSVTTYDEMMFWDTNLTNTASKVIGPNTTLNGNELVLAWRPGPNRSYALQGSTDLQSWQTVASGLIGSHTERLDAANAPPYRFFCLIVTLDSRDTDGNGLVDWEEARWQQAYGRSINLTDIDGDGLLDIQEFQQGQDPRKKDHPAVGLVVFTPLEK